MAEARTSNVSAPGTSYDAVPYESYPFATTHISHLHMLGRLHGMAPVDYRRCRVLELGGAAGGNLIPMAMDFPDSEFLGIDLSARQIEAGKVHVANLGLKNIELRTASIMDVGADYGQFDYIICADVLEHLRAPLELLKECHARLAPGGMLVGSLPNSGHFYFRWNVLMGRFPQHQRGLFDSTHLHFYTWDGWVNLLRRAGFRVEAARCSGVPVGLAFPRWQESAWVHALEWVSFQAARVWKSLCAYQFIVRTRAEHTE